MLVVIFVFTRIVSMLSKGLSSNFIRVIIHCDMYCGNQFLEKSFIIKCGVRVRHGGVLSPYLFKLCTDDVIVVT